MYIWMVYKMCSVITHADISLEIVIIRYADALWTIR